MIKTSRMPGIELARKPGYENGLRFARLIKVNDLLRIFKGPALGNLVNISYEAKSSLGLKKELLPLKEVLNKMVSTVKSDGTFSASKVRSGGYTSLLSVNVTLDRFILSMRCTTPFYGAGEEKLVFYNLILLPQNHKRIDDRLNKKEDPKYSRASLLH